MSRYSSSRFLTAAISAALAICTSQAALAHGHSHPLRAPLELVPVGTYSTGLGSASAEIVAFDPGSERLFVTNAGNSTVDILDARNPAQLTNLRQHRCFGLRHAHQRGGARRASWPWPSRPCPRPIPATSAFYKTNGELLTRCRSVRCPTC